MLGNIFVLGDSYSTFQGYIPEGYSAYYTTKGPYYLEKIPELKFNDNDVCEVGQTWWYDLATQNGTLLLNCSWSGTTICNTGYNGRDDSEISFVGRMEKLFDEGYFEKNKVDTFFLFGGTNDSFADVPFGKEIYSDWKDEDLYHVFPAFSYLVDKLANKLPSAKIYCIINTELKEEITEFYKKACKKSGVSVIELHNIDKVESHPTVKGMLQIKEQILDFINHEK